MPQSSILRHPFLMSPLLKNVSTPMLEPTNGIKQCCLPSLSFKNSLKANINIY